MSMHTIMSATCIRKIDIYISTLHHGGQSLQKKKKRVVYSINLYLLIPHTLLSNGIAIIDLCRQRSPITLFDLDYRYA